MYANAAIPKAAVARLPRYVISGQLQHIIQRSNNRQVIFAAETDCYQFRGALIDAAEKHRLAIHAVIVSP